MRCARALLLGALLLLPARGPAAAVEALVLHHNGDGATLAQRLMATGLFANVDERDGLAGTPSLLELLPYDSVLVYGASAPLFPDTLGDVLAAFAKVGHRVVLAGYSFSDPFAVQGRIMGPGFAPLQNAGVKGDVSSQISVVPGHETDPLFAGVTISGVAYFHNANYAHPTVDVGATLLARDQSGTQVAMVARSANGRVVSVNIFPDDVNETPLSADGVRLLANALLYESVPALPDALVPLLLALLLAGAAPALWAQRRRSATRR